MELGAEQARITSFLEESLVNLITDRPYTSQERVVSPRLTGRIAAEASSLPKVIFRNSPEWVHTKRATLFPSGVENSPRLISGLFRSEDWVPTAQKLASRISTEINLLGASTKGSKTPLEPLLNWRPNRIGFNLTTGQPQEPGYIPNHIDPPRLSGLVAVVELLGKSPGTMKIIYGADICAILGIPQPNHGVPKTTSTRLSMTIGMLLKNKPLT
jgi:hypothetical protein